MKQCRERILILGRSPQTAAAKSEYLLSSGFYPAICIDMPVVCEEVSRGVGALLIAQETLTQDSLTLLVDTLKAQPAWSQIPIVIMLDRGELAEGHSTWLEILEPLGNVTLVERPVSEKTLITVMRTAMSLRQRQYEVRELLAKLEISNRSRSEFLTNMSHEIRTPLCAVLGFSELLMDRTIGTQERSAYIQTIRRNGAALSGLIEDILDLNRAETGQCEVCASEGSLMDLIDDVIVDLEYDATKKGLALIIERGKNFPEVVCADLSRLRQILQHVVGNAIKFTSHGAVTLRIAGGPNVTFEIEDTGIGISKLQSEDLFKPFTQVDSSTTRRHGGSGLGLALAQKLARAMGGDLNLKWSVPGGGSCFKLTLGISPIQNTIPRQKQVDCVAN